MMLRIVFVPLMKKQNKNTCEQGVAIGEGESVGVWKQSEVPSLCNVPKDAYILISTVYENIALCGKKNLQDNNLKTLSIAL